VTQATQAEILARPFGAASRAELIEQFFRGRAVTTEEAWKDVYRLLLWIDRTTGLAHCYESDKAQPGRAWYARSLAFHAWVAERLDIPAAELGQHLDWLFREATERLAAAALAQQAARARAAEAQRAPWAELRMPAPGDDPELREILERLMNPDPSLRPEEPEVGQVMQELRAHFANENRRKNLLGEGFEDVLGAILSRLPGGGPAAMYLRRVLHEIPGFRPPPSAEKPRRVDLALVMRDGRRALVSVKWSVRADREEQFGVDFDTYARLEDSGEDFEFVLVTNEFDAARLVSACDRRAPGRRLFDRVVHVNPEGVLAVYADAERGAAARLPELVGSGRLTSLASWLSQVSI
jgi:hypothetical protein